MSEPKTSSSAWHWLSDLTFLSCSSALAGALGGTPSTSLALASVSLDPTLSCVGSHRTKLGPAKRWPAPPPRLSLLFGSLLQFPNKGLGRAGRPRGHERPGCPGQPSGQDRTGPPRCGISCAHPILTEQSLHAESLRAISWLGNGSWGVVSLMQHQTGPNYAVKRIDLSQIQTDLGLLRITREKDIHLNLKSPFVIRLFGAYLQEVLVQVCPKQTEEAIHFVMEPGVFDLRMACERHREVFRSQKHATFYAASVVCALQ